MLPSDGFPRSRQARASWRRKFCVRRGFSLLEVVIAMGIMGGVLAIFGYLFVHTLSDARRQTVYMRSHSAAMKGMEALRELIMPARSLSSVLQNNGRTIEFNDPWVGETTRSSIAFVFNGTTNRGEVLHRRDIASGTPISLFEFDVEDLIFDVDEVGTLNSGSLISVQFVTPAAITATDQRPFVITDRFRTRSYSR